MAKAIAEQTVMMNIVGMYCLGFHDKHMRPGRVAADPDSETVRFVDPRGGAAVGPERFRVVFDELYCPTHGTQYPELLTVVPMAEMGDWYFFDTREQREAFEKALKDRDAGLPYDRTLTARRL